MEKLRFTFELVNDEENDKLELSKFFGSPTFPRHFIQKHHLVNSLFLCQINLNQISKYNVDYLPKEGMLYFFLEQIDSFHYQAKVIYTKEELIECIDMINEDFIESDDWHALYMNFTLDEVESYLISHPDEQDDVITSMDTNGYIILLTIDPLDAGGTFPNLGSLDGYYYFLIKEEELKKLNFKHVLFISTES